jgi:soluble lytic murein transglycosylase-like protein
MNVTDLEYMNDEQIILLLAAGSAILLSRSVNDSERQYLERDQNIARWYPEIKSASQKTGVPVPIIAAVMWQESRGRENEPGSAGEVGLMQLLPDAVTDGINAGFKLDPYPSNNPEMNILQGAAYLAVCKQKIGNWYDAIRGYNAGWPRIRQGNKTLSIQYANSVKNKAVQYGSRDLSLMPGTI